jgi:hypothetical protein
MLRLGSAKPSPVEAVDYLSERIAAGIFATPLGLDLPESMYESFRALAYELDHVVASGSAEQWLRGYAGPGAFTVAFIRSVAGFIHDCTDPPREVSIERGKSCAA